VLAVDEANDVGVSGHDRRWRADKPITAQVLRPLVRHTLLEAGDDLCTIQLLRGHLKLEHTSNPNANVAHLAAESRSDALVRRPSSAV